MQAASGQQANSDELIGRTVYFQKSLWKEIEPLSFSRGKLIPVSMIKNDPILQNHYLEQDTWFKILEVSEIEGKKYYKLETEKRYYYLEKTNKIHYAQYADDLDAGKGLFASDDDLMGHCVYFKPQVWKNVTVYSISGGKIKPISEINDDILQKSYKDPETWFRFVETTKEDGKVFYKLETELRYYFLERMPSNDFYYIYATAKDISSFLVGKTFVYVFEAQDGLLVDKEITFLEETKVEYNSVARLDQSSDNNVKNALGYYVNSFTKKEIHNCENINGVIAVYKDNVSGKVMDVLEWKGNKLLEIKKKITYTLKE